MSSQLAAAPEQEPGHAQGPKRRPAAFVELITTVALAFSTAVAVTAVSIGIARAEVIGAVVKREGAPLAIALCVGLLLVAMGGIVAAVTARD
jgi:hypothetical protein